MIYIFILIVFLLDVISKWLLLALLTGPVRVTDFFNLYLVYNNGVSFSMLRETNTLVLAGISAAIALFLFHWLLKEPAKWTRIGLALIIGGALGNIFDRLYYGAVVDFLDFHWGPHHWPAFNLADTAICLGAFIIILKSLKRGKK